MLADIIITGMFELALTFTDTFPRAFSFLHSHRHVARATLRRAVPRHFRNVTLYHELFDDVCAILSVSQYKPELAAYECQCVSRRVNVLVESVIQHPL